MPDFNRKNTHKNKRRYQKKSKNRDAKRANKALGKQVALDQQWKILKVN